jgi:hypothetical protein
VEQTQEAAVESKCVKLVDFERLEKDHEELKAQLAALTAVVGGITTAGAVDFQRLEECVEFALKGVRPRARPVLLAKAAAVLEDLEEMQKALKIEKRKNRGLKAARTKSPSSRVHG